MTDGEIKGEMAKDQDVVRIAKRLDKMVLKKNTDGAIDLLKQLESTKMSLETLQSTRIGMSVNAVRKQSSDAEVQTLARSLIKSWKKLLEGDEKKKKGESDPVESPSTSKDSGTSKSKKAPKTSTTPAPPSRITSFPPDPVIADGVRLKCRELLVAALQTDGDHMTIGANCDHLAEQIEDLIFQEFKATDIKYKNRLRSRISNLKDQKNPDLRKNVLCGTISPERIATMTAEEMASAELKQIRDDLTKKSFRNHQLSKVGGTETDMFICKNCQSKNCTYTQVQTVSADESVTTFVLCNFCGNRWKVHELLLSWTSMESRSAGFAERTAVPCARIEVHQIPICSYGPMYNPPLEVTCLFVKGEVCTGTANSPLGMTPHQKNSVHLNTFPPARERKFETFTLI
ncbi:transcription elongation factor A protein 2 [Lampris incognitus]|uniref:transcription elongation factor A protein 2 n=1 Tax=Lampris incognitus TaxID=2546036 RepID=UPI0024B5A45C|nr:transcription elongation factor A protein 2 [Lampris incognitus]